MKRFLRRQLETALGQTGGLELLAPVLNAGLNGARLGRRSGNALEFAEYRDYQSGDDLRRLDWNVYARSEQLMVKLFSEEIDPRCDIVLDHSASMLSTPEKAAAALGLAGILAQAARQASFSLRLFHARETLEPEPFPGDPLVWQDCEFDAAANPDRALERFAGRFQPRGLRILLSDLLYEADPKPLLARLSGGAKQLAIFQILADGELGDPEPGEWILFDAERNLARELAVDETAVRRFRDRAAAHQAMWRHAAQECGTLLLTLETSQLLPDWDMQPLFQAGLLR